MKNAPGYLKLYEEGSLAERVHLLEEKLVCCSLCPRRCGVDRTSGQLGACGVGVRPKVAAMNIHPWEEPPISGTGGSGTIFFTGCTLQCLFCQNFPISRMGVGRSMTVEELAAGMVDLQKKGAHNINLVTSTHQMPAVVSAVAAAVHMGLRIPLVYNCSGYESLETLRLLDGIIDIYLPDIKYSDPEKARLYSGRADYVEHDRAALREMWRQVGPLKVDDESIAYRGMMVRHLVLPENLSGTSECFRFLVESFGTGVWVSLMNQYFPAHLAYGVPPLDRKATEEEYEAACALLTELGIDNGFVQACGDDGSCELDV